MNFDLQQTPKFKIINQPHKDKKAERVSIHAAEYIMNETSTKYNITAPAPAK